MYTCIKLVVSKRARTLDNLDKNSIATTAWMAIRSNGFTFPPHGYQPTPVNTLLANALDLSAPASDALLKNRKNAWVQLAGHPGSLAPAGPHTIWKRQQSRDNSEMKAYRALMEDSIQGAVPKFYREVEYNGELFIEIEDLLQHFHDPNIMDIKMGTRTFLESEVKNPSLRPDLYEKMIKIDRNEPTPEEHELHAITKLRYMQFREMGSSSATLGFRIEAVRQSGEPPNTDLKLVSTTDEVRQTISRFVAGNQTVSRKMLTRLRDMRSRFESSKYFRHHEIIGSSLLVLYDAELHVGIWMIDFVKTTLVDHIVSHRSDWQLGNHEDGYLTGLDNLIQIFTDLCVPQRHCDITSLPTGSVQNHVSNHSSSTNHVPRTSHSLYTGSHVANRDHTRDQSTVTDRVVNHVDVFSERL